jgi:hypothetical protein
MAMTDEEIYRRVPRHIARAAERERLDSPIARRDVRNWALWLAGAWIACKFLDAIGFSELFH